MTSRDCRSITLRLRGPVCALMASALAGCATAPTPLRQGSLSVMLPTDFEDATQSMVEQAHTNDRLTAHLARQGVSTEPMLAFQSTQEARHSGGCGVNRTRLHPTSAAWSRDLRALALDLTQSQAREMLHPQPWQQMSRGRALHLNPWLAAESVKVVSSTPATLAGLPAWQLTVRMHWETQPGPVQPVSMVRLILADLAPGTATRLGDRVMLQAMCGTVDLPGYVDTTLSDLDAILSTLRLSPPTAP
ncbi:MAG TPA: hypothetical protein VFH49_08915 [Aquabacterium sp.]|nr:hypothetical protein [Aquabacterium sp.]